MNRFQIVRVIILDSLRSSPGTKACSSGASVPLIRRKALPAPSVVSGGGAGLPDVDASFCLRSRGDGAGLLLGNFLLSTQPIIEIVTICPAALLVEFIRALSDLFFEILGRAPAIVRVLRAASSAMAELLVA